MTNLTEIIGTWGASVLAWASGEIGRIYIAGGLGGALRWINSHKRRLRDGPVAIIAGSVSARFFHPIVGNILEGAFGEFARPEDAIATSAFVAGLLGMSLGKLLIAVIEGKFGAVKSGGSDEK
ncbi:hypothetical protein [Marinovum algicola]|uniref:hypothetical protein n=1 Tax=Marinovum algicola TaxID=42444 RepID=UPI003B525AFA